MTATAGETLAALAERLRSEGREVLLEPEGLEVVRALGIAVPEHCVLAGAAEAESLELERFPGDRLVVKVVSPRILHKSDVGGVRVVAKTREALGDALREMEERFADDAPAGYLVSRFVPHERTLGRELLLGARWTPDFGPVVTLGPGGIYAEFLSANLRPGRDVAILSPGLDAAGDLAAAYRDKAITQLASGGLRGQEALIEEPVLQDLLRRFLGFAAAGMPHDLLEFEINPLVLSPEGPVALDVLARIGAGAQPAGPERPLDKIEALLRPRRIAVVGVSQRMNPGRIMLQNVLRNGYPPEQVRVVKPGCDEIDGCRCVPDLGSLPEPVDLLIVGVDAAQVPAVLEEVIRGRLAESLIVVPGGMGEREGSEGIQSRVRDLLAASRATPWRGPVLNGGNCLGIRSRPGRYDTLFIPVYKMPQPAGPVSPLAVISQSGAFGVARGSRLGELNPRYLITIGNQADLTVGDYLEFLADDPEVEVFACYVEGFRPLDGLRFVRAAAKIRDRGGSVILYRAGRTASGAQASASHTASIAGDYAVTRELARQAGAIVTETLADYDDLVRLFCFLAGRSVPGWRMGAFSNAGFECVAMADNLGRFELADFDHSTEERLGELFAQARLDKVVDVHNPVDVTPIMNDELFAAGARAVLTDPHVDVGIIGCVPMTGALNTLGPGEGHHENVAAEGSIARRLVELKDAVEKPWVAVVDGGPHYDAFARYLADHGVPTFRTADRALRLFEVFCAHRS